MNSTCMPLCGYLSEPCYVNVTSDMSVVSGGVEDDNDRYRVEGGETVEVECRPDRRRFSAKCEGAVFKPDLSCTVDQQGMHSTYSL